MKVRHAITYPDVFPEEKTPAIEDFLKDVPTRLAIEHLCFFNSMLHINAFDPLNQILCLRELLGGQAQNLRTRVLFAGAVHKKKYGEFLLFDIYTNLILINKALANRNQIDNYPEEPTDKERELILRSVLLANQNMNDAARTNVKGIENKLDKFCALMWPTLVQTTDHRTRNDFMLYAYKSYTFLQYIKDKPEIVKYFIKHYDLASSEEVFAYMTEILTFYVNVGMDKVNNKLHHAFNFNIEKEYPMLKNYIIDLADEKLNFIEADFKSLRQKPIIKIRENRYDMSNWNFLLEKLGNGLLFDLFYNTELKNDYLNKRGEPKFDTFKGKIGDYYAEKLFQLTFSKIILKPGDIYIPGDPAREDNSDFYLRRGNKIILIEFKDALMVKHSSYEKIKDYVDGKLNSDSKGTGQLKKLLDKFNANPNVFEKDLTKKINLNKLVIYPIIFVSEGLFSSSGFTQYLNREFKKKLANKKYNFYIKPLIVIDFDLLLENYDVFKSNKIDFLKCLDYFHLKQIERRRKSRRTNDPHVIIKSFNGFREDVWKILPRSKKTFELGTLGNYVVEAMNLSKAT